MNENFLRFIWYMSGIMINEPEMYIKALNGFMEENQLSKVEQHYITELVESIKKSNQIK